jgi:two-component system, OmpR family, phosphate regulon response regulator PhoB
MPHVPVVLVVEDEPSVRTTLCAALTQGGFKAHAAEHVDAALKILGSEHVDAVSLDVRLPDWGGQQRNGLSLLTFLRATAEYAHVPVIIFTGVPLSPNEEALARTHDAQVFCKPQAHSVLIEHLSRLLESSPAA